MERLVRNLLGSLSRNLIILVSGILFTSVLVYLPCILFGCSPVSIMCVDPAIRRPFVQEFIDAMMAHYGLVAEPDVWNWVTTIWATFTNSIHANFGLSFLYMQPVSRLIGERLPNTALLIVAASAIAGVSLRRMSNRQEKERRTRARYAVFGSSVPNFWFGMMLLISFSFMLPEWTQNIFGVEIGAPQFGTISYEVWEFARISSLGAIIVAGDLLLHLALPAFVLSRFIVFSLAHLLDDSHLDDGHTRSLLATIASCSSDVVKMIPRLVSALVLLEVVFTWRGVGAFLFQSILLMDTPSILGALVSILTITIAMTLVVESSGEISRYILGTKSNSVGAPVQYSNGGVAGAVRAYLLGRLPVSMDITRSAPLMNTCTTTKEGGVPRY